MAYYPLQRRRSRVFTVQGREHLAVSRYRRVTVLRPSNYWRNWITTKVRSRTWIAVCESLPRVRLRQRAKPVVLATMPGMDP